MKKIGIFGGQDKAIKTVVKNLVRAMKNSGKKVKALEIKEFRGVYKFEGNDQILCLEISKKYEKSKYDYLILYYSGSKILPRLDFDLFLLIVEESWQGLDFLIQILRNIEFAISGKTIVLNQKSKENSFFAFKIRELAGKKGLFLKDLPVRKSSQPRVWIKVGNNLAKAINMFFAFNNGGEKESANLVTKGKELRQIKEVFFRNWFSWIKVNSARKFEEIISYREEVRWLIGLTASWLKRISFSQGRIMAPYLLAIMLTVIIIGLLWRDSTVERRINLFLYSNEEEMAKTSFSPNSEEDKNEADRYFYDLIFGGIKEKYGNKIDAPETEFDNKIMLSEVAWFFNNDQSREMVELIAKVLRDEEIKKKYSIADLPLSFVMAMAIAESYLIHYLSDGSVKTSRRGAEGLMQIMPEVAQSLNEQLVSKERVFKIRKPEDNIILGLKLYSMLLDQFSGNMSLAVKAYNAGPRVVKIVLKDMGITKIEPDKIYYNVRIDSETDDYLVKIINYERVLKVLLDPLNTSYQFGMFGDAKLKYGPQDIRILIYYNWILGKKFSEGRKQGLPAAANLSLALEKIGIDAEKVGISKDKKI